MLIVIESIKNKITTIRKYQELYIKIFVLLLTKGKKTLATANNPTIVKKITCIM